MKKILFTILAILFILFTLEIFFRGIYSIKYHKNYMTFGFKNVFKFDVNQYRGYVKLEKPEYKGAVFCRGFRTLPFPIKKPKGEYRIVVLGGSSTYGIQGGYYKSWPYLLEKKLGCRVINAGLCGQSTYGVNNLLKYEVVSWNPDMVIIYSLFNHINFDTPTLYKADNQFFRTIKVFCDRSLLATYIIHTIGLRKDKTETYRYLLNEMTDTCHKNGIDIIIVKQLINTKGYDKLLKVIDEFDNVDFSTYPKTLLFDEVHLTTQGKEVLVDIIIKKVRAK